MVRGLVADRVTVLLTTQYLDEADQLAHDIVVFDHGRVVATGTPDELKAKTGGQVLQVAPAEPDRMAEVTALMAEVIRAEVSTNAETGVATAPAGDAALVRHVFRELDDRGIELAEFALRKPSMDEVFFALTGRRASVPAETTRPAFRASKVSNTRNWRPPTWTGRPVSSRT